MSTVENLRGSKLLSPALSTLWKEAISACYPLVHILILELKGISERKVYVEPMRDFFYLLLANFLK